MGISVMCRMLGIEMKKRSIFLMVLKSVDREIDLGVAILSNLNVASHVQKSQRKQIKQLT